MLAAVKRLAPAGGFADDIAGTPELILVQEPFTELGRHTVGGGSSVSRKHATLSLRYDDTTGHSWWLKPLGRNKVSVNGRHFFANGDDEDTIPVEIWSGDVLKLGKMRTLRFLTDITAGQRNTWSELLRSVELADINSDTGADNANASDARNLVRNIVRVQTELHIEPSLSLRDTLAEAEQLLQLPKTIHRAAEGTADFERIEAFAQSTERILKLLDARLHLLDQAQSVA
jgi:hypothetical protein